MCRNTASQHHLSQPYFMGSRPQLHCLCKHQTVVAPHGGVWAALQPEPTTTTPPPLPVLHTQGEAPTQPHAFILLGKSTTEAPHALISSLHSLRQSSRQAREEKSGGVHCQQVLVTQPGIYTRAYSMHTWHSHIQHQRRQGRALSQCAYLHASFNTHALLTPPTYV